MEDRQGRTDNRVRNFEDLDVYAEALNLQQEVFDLSKSFPKEERYSLTDQIRRSSGSIGANIAEAWHKRRYPAHFASKLSDADGEQGETRHWLRSCQMCCYVTEEQYAGLRERCRKIGAMLGSMMKSPEKWCH